MRLTIILGLALALLYGFAIFSMFHFDGARTSAMAKSSAERAATTATLGAKIDAVSIKLDRCPR